MRITFPTAGERIGAVRIHEAGRIVIEADVGGDHGRNRTVRPAEEFAAAESRRLYIDGPRLQLTDRGKPGVAQRDGLHQRGGVPVHDHNSKPLSARRLRHPAIPVPPVHGRLEHQAFAEPTEADHDHARRRRPGRGRPRDRVLA